MKDFKNCYCLTQSSLSQAIFLYTKNYPPPFRKTDLICIRFIEKRRAQWVESETVRLQGANAHKIAVGHVENTGARWHTPYSYSGQAA